MLIHRIQENGSVREFYRDRDWGYLWAEAKMMLALVRYLEEEVDHPAVWAYTSHLNLVLTDENAIGKWKVRIGAHPVENFIRTIEKYAGNEVDKATRQMINEVETNWYEIRYALPTPWSHGVGYADDIETASELVIAAWKNAGSSVFGSGLGR